MQRHPSLFLQKAREKGSFFYNQSFFVISPIKSIPLLKFSRDHLRSTLGITCGRGSFAVHFGDHLRTRDHLRLGIICGTVQSNRRKINNVIQEYFFCQHSLVQNTLQLLRVHCLLREKLLFHRRMNAWYYSRDLFRNSNVENLRSFLTNSMHELI